MGQDFYEKYPSARQVFDQASQWLSLDMKALCFEKNDRLNLTEYTQAALVTTCLAMEKVVEECGLHPDITAGLSLGEYCAIAVSGGMSMKDAIVTVRKRGILMEHAVPAGEGSMAAVIGLDADKIQNCEAERSRCKTCTFPCSKWPFSFLFASKCRKRTGKRTVKSRAFRSEDSLCDQCDRPVCDRHQRDKKSSCKADFFLCSLAAECGKDDSGGCGYFRRNWSRKDFGWFYEENSAGNEDL